MKNILLKAVCIAAIALPFSAQMVKAATITANLSDVTNTNTQNYPTVKITLSDDGQPAGTVKVIATVINGPTGGTGDLLGIAFNLPSGVTNATITPTGGGPITAVSGVTNSFGSVSKSVNLNGAGTTFGVVVQVGQNGIGQGDDFQSVEFTISGTGLDLADFSQAQFGTRLMSVSTSAGGARDDSAKTLGNGGTVVTPPSPSPSTSPSPSPSPSPTGGGGAPSPSPSVPTDGGGGGGGTPPDVAEPITILGMGLGLGGLLLSRRNRNKNK